MSHPGLSGVPVLVVGVGVMGVGIAQVAAQAGHRVYLFDLRPGAAAAAKAELAATWQKLVAKGKLAADAAQAALARIVAAQALSQASDAGLVIEAVAEKLEVKRALFRELELLVSKDAVLASNTSSISVTALAQGLAAPERVVGMHFFNPVPVMKLVEVVSGLLTRPAVADAVFALSEAWGKVPVQARSTPGFIVNRVARPFYGEAWALLQEQAAAPAVIDACMRGAGFRMGPCALMDLIGHDVSLAVTQSVYQAFFGDKRYQPSVLQREMVDAGLLGKKSGRGFYDHRGSGDGAAAPALTRLPPPQPDAALRLHGRGALAERWSDVLTEAGHAPQRTPDDEALALSVGGARLCITDGRPATKLSVDLGLADVAVFDLPLFGGNLGDRSEPSALAFSVSATASDAWAEQAARWLQLLGYEPRRVADTPGLVVARTVAMLVNEAADAVLQGVCSAAAADAAMKLGVNYPAGPFEWLSQWGAASVVGTIDHLDAHYRGERYRTSPALRQRAWCDAVSHSLGECR